MSGQFILDIPVNSVSFGQVSTAILREVQKRGLNPPIFPIGPVDLSTQKGDPYFVQWLNGCVNEAQKRFSRKNPALKLWHISGSGASYSDRGNDLLTFFELDGLTPTEVNLLRNQRKVYVTNRFTQSVLAQFGIQTVYVPLGFDSFNFSPLPARPKVEGTISFLLAGKLEKRKGHLQVLAAWAKKYGNKKEYRLNCAVSNHFMRPEDQNAIIGNALGGKQYWNINWLQWAPTNAEYNTTLQSSDIIISCSGGEGRDLPCFHATALGAWPIALRAHAYLDYLNDDNAILINPNGKTPATDGVFFHQGQPINQGNLYTFGDEDFYVACEEAEKRVRTIGINKIGTELQKSTYAETLDVLLANIES
jgi:hypothetical protein